MNSPTPSTVSVRLFQKLRLFLAVCVALLPGAPRLRADTASTQAVVDAANAFMSLLTASQKTAIDSASAPVNTSVLYNASLANVEVWSNLPVSTSLSGATRNGLLFSSLTTGQQVLAIDVIRTALGTTGRALFNDVRAADRYISGEVVNAKGTTNSAWGYGKYCIGFVGTPSTTAPWTLQIGGHHLAFNLTFNGPSASSTPMFAGAEPNSWTDSTGTYAPLGVQRNLLVSLRQTLSASALLAGTFSDVVFGPKGSGPGATNSHDTVQPKAYPTTGRGQLYSTLTAAQQTLVKQYIESWVNTQVPANAADLLTIYESPQALAETYVGYSGSSPTLAQNANYFRVDGPRLWIEFSVQTGGYDPATVHDAGLWRDKLADYGTAYGNSTISTTVRPPVISAPPLSQTVPSGASVTFSVTAANAGTGAATLSYQWFKGAAAIADATNPTYTIASVAAGDVASYSVRVLSTGGLTTSQAAGLTLGSGGVVAPVITAPVFPVTILGDSSFSFALSATNAPTNFTATGLPAGLRLDAATGVISGRPLAAGTFPVLVRASNAAGASALVRGILTVQALPANVVGRFFGIIAGQAAVNGSVGGRLDLVTTAAGAFTLRLSQGATSSTLTGLLRATPGGNAHVAATIGNLALVLDLDAATNSLSGAVYLGNISAAITGWRAIWNEATNPARSRAGYYTLAINLASSSDIGEETIPQGTGFARVVVATSGVVTIAATAADGTPFTATSFLGPNGEIGLSAPLYAGGGSMAGTLALTPGATRLGNTITGSLTWLKPEADTRIYDTGFGPITLAAEGKYLAPAQSGFVVAGLPAATSPASLRFLGGGLSVAAVNPDVFEFTLTSASRVVFHAASGPDNPGRATLTINPENGLIAGQYTLVDGTLTRTAGFHGIIVRTASGNLKAAGYFLLRQIPAAGQTTATTPIFSGRVMIEQ